MTREQQKEELEFGDGYGKIERQIHSLTNKIEEFRALSDSNLSNKEDKLDQIIGRGKYDGKENSIRYLSAQLYKTAQHIINKDDLTKKDLNILIHICDSLDTVAQEGFWDPKDISDIRTRIEQSFTAIKEKANKIDLVDFVNDSKRKFEIKNETNEKLKALVATDLAILFPSIPFSKSELTKPQRIKLQTIPIDPFDDLKKIQRETIFHSIFQSAELEKNPNVYNSYDPLARDFMINLANRDGQETSMSEIINKIIALTPKARKDFLNAVFREGVEIAGSGEIIHFQDSFQLQLYQQLDSFSRLRAAQALDQLQQGEKGTPGYKTIMKDVSFLAAGELILAGDKTEAKNAVDNINVDKNPQKLELQEIEWMVRALELQGMRDAIDMINQLNDNQQKREVLKDFWGYYKGIRDIGVSYRNQISPELRETVVKLMIDVKKDPNIVILIKDPVSDPDLIPYELKPIKAIELLKQHTNSLTLLQKGFKTIEKQRLQAIKDEKKVQQYESYIADCKQYLGNEKCYIIPDIYSQLNIKGALESTPLSKATAEQMKVGLHGIERKNISGSPEFSKTKFDQLFKTLEENNTDMYRMLEQNRLIQIEVSIYEYEQLLLRNPSQAQIDDFFILKSQQHHPADFLPGGPLQEASKRAKIKSNFGNHFVNYIQSTIRKGMKNIQGDQEHFNMNDLKAGASNGLIYFKNLAKKDPEQFTREVLLWKSDWLTATQGTAQGQELFTRSGGILEALFTYTDITSSTQKKQGLENGKSIINQQLGKYGLDYQSVHARSLETDNLLAGSILHTLQNDVMKIAILLKHYNNNSPEVTKTQISEIAHTIKDTFDAKKEDLRKELRAKFLPETRLDEVEKTLDTFIAHINGKNFKDSDLMQRIKSDALPTLCAIAAGVGLAMATGGGSIIGMAFRGAVGGELGSGVGIVANNAIHHSIGSDYHQNTIIGNLLTDPNYDISEALTTESKRITMGTITSATFMGLGRGISFLKANHLNAGSFSARSIATMESVNQYLSTAVPEQFAKRLGHFGAELMEEYRQEMMGMAVEKATKDTDFARVGNAANVLFSMNKQQVNIANCDVATSHIEEQRDEVTGQRVVNTSMVLNSSDPHTVDRMTRFFQQNGVSQAFNFQTDAQAARSTTLSYSQEVEMTQEDGTTKKEVVTYTYTIDYSTINSDFQSLCSNNNLPIPRFVSMINGVETCSFIAADGGALINTGQQEMLLAGLAAHYSVIDRGNGSYELILGRKHIILEFPKKSDTEAGRLTRLQGLQSKANANRSDSERIHIEENSELHIDEKYQKLQEQFPNNNFLRSGFIISPQFQNQAEAAEFYKNHTNAQIISEDDIKLAIDEAHEAGGALFNLSFGDLRERYEILSNIGINREAIGFLLDNGYCAEKGYNSDFIPATIFDGIEHYFRSKSPNRSLEKKGVLEETIQDFIDFWMDANNDHLPDAKESGYITWLLCRHGKSIGPDFQINIEMVNAVQSWIEQGKHLTDNKSLTAIMQRHKNQSATKQNQTRLNFANATTRTSVTIEGKVLKDNEIHMKEIFSRKDFETIGNNMHNCLNDFGEDEFNPYHNRIKKGTTRIFTVERGRAAIDTIIVLDKTLNQNTWSIREIKKSGNELYNTSDFAKIKPVLSHLLQENDEYNITGLADIPFIRENICNDIDLRQHLHKITSLSFKGYSQEKLISKKIENLSAVCPNLEQISLEECNLSDTSLTRLPKLKHLRLKNCYADEGIHRCNILNNKNIKDLHRKSYDISNKTNPFLYNATIENLRLTGGSRDISKNPDLLTGLSNTAFVTINGLVQPIPPTIIPSLQTKDVLPYIYNNKNLGYDFARLIPRVGPITDPQRRSVVETILSIPETQEGRTMRFEIFKAMIGVDLTPEQKNVIQSTHDKNDDGSDKSIKEKFDILTNSGLFSPQQVRMLLKRGICGTNKIEVGTKWRSDGSFSKVTNYFEDSINVDIVGQTFVKTYKSTIPKSKIDAYYEVQSKFKAYVEKHQNNSNFKVVDSPISIEKYKNYTIVTLPLVSGTTLENPVKQGDGNATKALDIINDLWKEFVKKTYEIEDISSISPINIMETTPGQYTITDVATSLGGLNQVLLLEKSNLVATLNLSELAAANLPNLEKIENVNELVGKNFDIVSSKSGRTLSCTITGVSTEIGKGGYGAVYIINANIGNEKNEKGRNIQFAIKLLDPNKNRNATVFKNSAKTWKIIKNLGLPTFTTYRPVANNENILAMTLLSTNEQLCVSLNNDSKDKSGLKDVNTNFHDAKILAKAEIIRISEILTQKNIKFNHDMFFLLVNKNTGSIKVMIGDFDNVSTKKMDMDKNKNPGHQDAITKTKKVIFDNNQEQTDLAIEKLNTLFPN